MDFNQASGKGEQEEKPRKMLSEIRQTFVPVEKPMDAEINFSDYMLQWLQIIKPTVATTTYASYSSIVQKNCCSLF